MPSSLHINNSANMLLDFAKSGVLSHATIIECENIKEVHDFLLNVIKTKFCTGSACPCGRCGNCIKIERGVHPDVMILESSGKSKSIKIEEIRKIREDAYIISNEGSGKFYVIENADYMTIQAQNALIKILEEPPDGVGFFLVCVSLDNLLPTIRSRAHIFKIKSNFHGLEESTLPEKIVHSSLNGKSDEILECLSGIDADRESVKELINDTIECFLKYLADERLNQVLINDIIAKVDRLKYLVSIIDKNVNMNLLVACMCAGL